MIAALEALGIVLRRPTRGEHRVACPWCRATKNRQHDEALGVRIAHDHAVWACFRCGETGRVNADQYERPRHRPPPAVAPQEPLEPRRGLARWAAALWAECRPIEPDDVAGRYLLGRRCALPPPDSDLRWHPAVRHHSGHVGPSLIALVTDAVTTEPLSLHRTWLAPDGSGKADVQPNRMLLKDHPVAGGCIRLTPDDEVTLGLAIAEGLETGLTAIAQGYPTWSCIDAGGLSRFPLLAGIECVTIIADRDPVNPNTGKSPGIHAARQCQRRWADAGVETRVWFADRLGLDLNDVAGEEP